LEDSPLLPPAWDEEPGSLAPPDADADALPDPVPALPLVWAVEPPPLPAAPPSPSSQPMENANNRPPVTLKTSLEIDCIAGPSWISEERQLARDNAAGKTNQKVFVSRRKQLPNLFQKPGMTL
jgi:hypothetical protein